MFKYDDWIKPSERIVKYFSNVFDIVNHKTELELKLLFQDKVTAENVGKRVNRLSAVYGTRISLSDQSLITDYIINDDIVAKATAGEADVVNKLAFNEASGYDRCLSFASKFCSFCNPNSYPIYDSLVLEALLRLNNEYKFDSVFSVQEKNHIKFNYDYDRFCCIIHNFRYYKEFNLTNCTLREIDKFLWIAGKGFED